MITRSRSGRRAATMPIEGESDANTANHPLELRHSRGSSQPLPTVPEHEIGSESQGE